MKITNALYRTLMAGCILLFCKIDIGQATELFQPTKISPLIGAGQENFTAEVTDFGVKGRTIKFDPNIAGIVRLGINAYGFGIGYSLRGSGKDVDSQKGTTEFSDWQLGYQAKNWGVDAYYQTYDGFYTSNTSAIQLFPKLSFKHSGVALRYAFGNEEFTVGGLLDQSEEITATSGKYYLVGSVHQHEMLTETPLLQQEYAGINPELENLRSLKAISINFGGGAGKHWVFSHGFFAGALFDLIGTYANYDYVSTTGKKSDSTITASYNLKFGFGYTGTTFRSGVSFNIDDTRLKATEGYINTNANKLLVYLRMVFD